MEKGTSTVCLPPHSKYPLEDSDLDIVDARIPFFQMVVVISYRTDRSIRLNRGSYA